MAKSYMLSLARSAPRATRCSISMVAYGVLQSEGFTTFLSESKGITEDNAGKVYDALLSVLDADADEKAYNVGVNIGSQLIDQVIPYINKELMSEEDFNKDAFFAAFYASMRGDDLLMDDMQAGAYVRQESEKRFASKMETEYGENKAAGIAFLENNLNADGTVNIPAPLQMYMGGKTKIG